LLKPTWKCCKNDSKDQNDALNYYMLASEKYNNEERMYLLAVDCLNKAVPLARKLKRYLDEGNCLWDIMMISLISNENYITAFNNYAQNARIRG